MLLSIKEGSIQISLLAVNRTLTREKKRKKEQTIYKDPVDKVENTREVKQPALIEA